LISGAKPHGLVHAVYELYGATEAGKLLTTLGRLFTLFLQFRGFTCGIDDMLLTKEAEERRLELIEKANQCGLEQAAIFTGLRQKDSTEPVLIKILHFR
jgi:DNA-directed RNA polymerase I subunit RPA1